MCRIDENCERAEVYTERRPRARKAYRCGECGRPIAPGERYLYVFIVFQGDSSSHRTCEHCAVAAEWLTHECRGYIFEEVTEDILEHAREYHSVGLYRLAVGAKRRWARFGGAGLMTVPAMPAGASS